MYEKDNRTYTFHQFESYDGAKWTDILKPGSSGKGAFKITFDPRLVSQIRVRGRNNVNLDLHFVRFQAFNISGKVPLVIGPPAISSSTLPQWTGVITGLVPSEPSRDASWKIISLPGGTSFKAGDNAFIQRPASSAAAGWIGITPTSSDCVPVGDYVFQTTFSMPTNCKTLDVSFTVDDSLKSVAVSDGTKTLQTITAFSGAINNGTFTVTDLPATTTMTFTANNSGGAFSFLVQFGACR